MDDRVFVKVIVSALLLAAVGIGVSILFKPTPILVGVLYSQTGTMAFSEKGVLAATLAAIDEVNAHGGVLGRPLQAVVADGKSDEHVFAQQAEQLLAKDKVAVIFGGWTSASRKAMLPVLAAHDGLLFYPMQYEGIEESANVIYTGMTPNQQLYPALTYMTAHLGKKVLLVGSDFIYPRMANAIATPILKGLNADVCAEVYVPLGSDDMSAVTKALARCKPDFVLNTVNGDSNLALFKALVAEPKSVPVMSLSIAEPELRQLITSLGESVTRDHYTVWGYFQSLATANNEQMLMQLHRTLSNAPINNPMKSAWDGVHLWAKAASLSGLLDAATLSKNIAGMSYSSASGVVSVDINNHHLWQRVYIGKANAKGQFDLVWQSQLPVAPLPWAIGHSHEGWQKQEQDFYQQWGGQWQAP